MSITELDSLRAELKTLRCLHRELDQQITEKEQQVYADSLEVKRMKKHKLRLKETITRLESQLIPDLNA